jgi:DNA-binding GntR family transcriptional regulator
MSGLADLLARLPAETRSLIASPSLREQVHSRLRALIVEGSLPGGTQLTPGEIAAHFGVSTMPVREALRRLEEEGFIETSPRRWTRVVSPDPALADEVYPMLAVLEELAVDTGDDAGPETIAAMRAANERLEAAAAERDVGECMAADAAFHEAMLQVCRSEALLATIADLKARIQLVEGAYFQRAHASESAAEHGEIVDALGRSERSKAANLVRQNWMHSLVVARELRASAQTGVEQ